MVGRSRLSPKPSTRTSAGRPIGSSISGRNMPELPISTHLPRPSCHEKISRDGSVYGLYAGLNRKFLTPILEKKTSMKPVHARETNIFRQ